jgi:hypothetical protein
MTPHTVWIGGPPYKDEHHAVPEYVRGKHIYCWTDPVRIVCRNPGISMPEILAKMPGSSLQNIRVMLIRRSRFGNVHRLPAPQETPGKFGGRPVKWLWWPGPAKD